MAPPPKQALQNAFSKDSFLDDDPDDDDWNASAAIAVARNHHHHDDNEGLVPSDLHRVTSRVVQSYTDGSAEAILATAAPSLSRTKSTVSPNNNNLSNSLPMTRTKSTPHTTNHAGGNVRLAYAMRKVFSREEKSEWRQQEAEELVHHHPNVQNNAPSPSSSSKVSRVSSHIQGSGAEDDAELVLDDNEFDTIDVNNRITADANLATAKAANEVLMEKAKGDKKSSAYKLRRFLSTPNSKSQKVSALCRTPSYEPEGYDEYGDAEYDEDDYERESPLYSNEQPHLSSPVGLTRTLSLRRNKSSSNEKKLQGKSNAQEDDDLSTVAESIDSPSFDQYGRDGKKKRKFIWKRIAIATFLLALGVTGVAVYMTLGNRQLEGNALVNNQLPDFDAFGGRSNDVQLAIATTSEDEDDAEFMVEIRTDDEAMSWASEDGTNNAEGTTSDAILTPILAINATSPPTTANPTSNEPTDNPSNKPTGNPSNEPTDNPSNKPTDNPSNKPTDNPSNKPTSETPTYAPTADTYTKFYIMADCPYDDNERYNLMPKYIKELSTDAEFVFHLGDLQYAKVDDCQEYAYEEASAILKKIPIPTFVLPGDNDINDCDDHEHGEEMWKKYFYKPDERWGPGHSLDVTRWGVLDESFSFLHKGVLYFGINIVGGTPYSRSEKKERHEEHLSYIRWILEKLDEDDFQVMVLLGHADPGYHHDDFFMGSDGFAAIVEEMGKPTVHFHGDYHEWYEVEGAFDVENYMRISLDGESIAPPIMVEIDVKRKNPIRVSRRRSDLDVECCKYGWPKHDEL